MPIKKIGVNGSAGIHKLRIFLQRKILFIWTAYSKTSEKLKDIMIHRFMLTKKIKVFGQLQNDYFGNKILKSVMKNIFEAIILSQSLFYMHQLRKIKYYENV